MTDDTFLGFGRTTSTTLSLLNASNFDLIQFKVPGTGEHAELSCILQLVACCDSFKEDGNEIPLVEVSPYLFEFLFQSKTSILWQDPAMIHESNNNNSIAVQVGPMSILPEFTSSSSHSFTMMATRIQKHVQDALPFNATLTLSCVYVDDDVLLDEQKCNDKLSRLIRSALQGRLIMPKTVMELSLQEEQSSSVRAFVTVQSITSGKDGRGDLVLESSDPIVSCFRIGAEDTFSVALYTTTKIQTSYQQKPDNAKDDNSSSNMLACPGYEPMVHQLVQLLSLESLHARPTAILLTGCAGVGKTFVASRIQSTLQDAKVHWISIQDVLLQSHGSAAAASNESKLIQSCLPSQQEFLDHQQGRLRLVVIMDDLHLLEKQNVEGLVLSNVILQVMDLLVQKHIPILGMTRQASQLPLQFLSTGRFEKEIMLPPPGQAQREAIWKYLFQSFARQEQQSKGPPTTITTTDGEEEYDNWALALSPMTIGFVPLDLCQVFASAWTLGRVSSSSQSKAALSWEHLVTSVQGFVPSQLRNVDLIKPTFFPVKNHTVAADWMEIHEQSWKSFGGYAKIKQRIYRTVVSPWRRLLMALEKKKESGMHETSKEVDNLMIHPPSGVLFHGPSGTGKTLAADCLASSMGLFTLKVRPFQVLDKWLGGSEAILRSLFARARSVAPCILFLDEIDAIATNRAAVDGSSESNNDLMSRLLSTLLNEMDGVSSGLQHGVLVVACTNRMDTLDTALLRPGRLEEHILLEWPSPNDIVEIMKVHLAKVPLANDILWEPLGERLFAKQCTAADVEGICREACSLALDRLTSNDGTISELTLTLRDLEDVMTD